MPRLGSGGFGALLKDEGQAAFEGNLWLLGDEKLLINHARWQRSMAENPGCSISDDKLEDNIHVIWDCSI